MNHPCLLPDLMSTKTFVPLKPRYSVLFGYRYSTAMGEGETPGKGGTERGLLVSDANAFFNPGIEMACPVSTATDETKQTLEASLGYAMQNAGIR